jgi:hypothetical protein
MLILLGVGVLATVGSWRLGLGSPEAPGPGLWPFIISLTLVTVAACLLFRPDPDAVEPLNRDALIVLVAALSLIVYTWLFSRLGFEIPTVLLLLLWLRVFGRDGWRLTISVAVGATAVIYLLFIVALGVSLPHIIVI